MKGQALISPLRVLIETYFLKIIFAFGILNFGHCDLPFDWAQGGEPVEPFGIWYLCFGISGLSRLGLVFSVR